MEVGEVRDLLSALEQSLQSVQVMRDELGKQYNENQKEAKQFELDLLTDDDLRNKLERQRLLFNSVVEQLKQARFVSDYSSLTSQVIEPAQDPAAPGLAPDRADPGSRPGPRRHARHVGRDGARPSGSDGSARWTSSVK